MALVESGLAAGPPLTLVPPEPPKRKRKRAKADVSHEHLRVLVSVYAALGTARLQAGMPAPHAVPYVLRTAFEEGTAPGLTADQAALLRCLVQLEQGAHGEPMTLADAEQLLVATVRAKVAEHAKRDDDFATGKHATIGALVVKANFNKWLAAGLSWLASGGRQALAHGARAVKGGRINANGSFTPTGRYSAADIFEDP